MGLDQYAYRVRKEAVRDDFDFIGEVNGEKHGNGFIIGVKFQLVVI